MQDDEPSEDDSFLSELFEHLIIPQIARIQERLNELDPEDLANGPIDLGLLDIDLPEDLSDAFIDLEGQALVVGGRDEEPVRQLMEAMQTHLSNGLSLDYILQEMTDLDISSFQHRQFGAISVNMVEVRSQSEQDTPALSAEELRQRFESE